MYFEVRRTFTLSSQPETLRSLIGRIGSNKVEHREQVTFKLRAFPVIPTSTGRGLTLFREGSPVDEGEVIGNPDHGADLLEVKPMNDPAWLDSLLIGRDSTSDGDWILVAILE